MKNIEGTKIPEITFITREHNEFKDISSSKLFKERTVVVFSLPGAFTPTCSSTHLPL